MPSGVSCAEDPKAIVDARFDSLVSTARITGATIIISDERGLLYQRSAGAIGVDTPVPIASASKWLTTAVIMSLVDDGQLSLDATVRDYVDDAPEAFGPITLRQLLSHTSGIEPQTVLQLRGASSSREVAEAIFATQLIDLPGSTFAYGGSSMQLAAYIAEVRMGKPWSQLFDERLAHPLGMTSVTWVHPLAVSEAATSGDTGPQIARGGDGQAGVDRLLGQGRAGSNVPLVASGLSMSAGDLSTFMQMILGFGQFDGVRVLSEASIQEMERLQTGTVADFRRVPVAMPAWRYGLGIWCEEVGSANACAVTNSAGAFGTVPWVDRSTGRAGVFVTRTQLPRILTSVLELRDLSESIQR
jgi:CubicO group peptidase (beta-lactamase class C family)